MNTLGALTMIHGIGMDLVELGRIGETIERQPRFPARILTERELARYQELPRKRQVEYLAGRFAAKEAFSKAYGTGIGQLSFQDIEILNEPSGRPVLTAPFDGVIHVTITHSEHYAAAQVLLEKRYADVSTDVD